MSTNTKIIFEMKCIMATVHTISSPVVARECRTHHLFPSMPRHNLRRVRGLVRDFCAATDLGYREENFVESFRQIVHHLSDAGAAASRCPD